LVDDLMTEWLLPRRAFRLSNAGEIGANPDQRIQEFVTVGIDEEVRRAIGAYPTGGGILGALIADATPLPGTAYKVEIAEALVRRALEAVA
jgi:hypothetical protein